MASQIVDIYPRLDADARAQETVREAAGATEEVNG
jgi:hypothetical protein